MRTNSIAFNPSRRDLLLAGCVAAAAPLGKAFASPPYLSPSVLREDFEVFRSAILEGHPGARTFLTHRSFGALFDALAAELASPIDEISFFRSLSKLIATLRDGHTRISLSAESEQRQVELPNFLPLKTSVCQGHIYVLYDLSGADTKIGGARIVSINGRSASQLLRQATALISGDGFIESAREYRLSNSFSLNRCLAMVGCFAPYSVILEDGRKLVFPGMSLSEMTKNMARHLSDKNLPAAEYIHEAAGPCVLTVRGFDAYADLNKKIPMKAFFKEVFSQIAQDRPRSLVIDVRGNSGGEDESGCDLFSYLALRPYAYYKGIYLQSQHFSFAPYANPSIAGPPPSICAYDADGRLRLGTHPNYGIHQPDPLRFGGPVYLIVNGGSFSTTSEFASIAYSENRVTVIGDECGGNYYGNTSGSVLYVTLPNSKIILRLPLERYELAVRPKVAFGHGVPAHFRIAPSARDILAARDPAMQLALQLVRKGSS